MYRGIYMLSRGAGDHPGVLELKILHRDIMRATAAFLLVLAHLALSHAWSCNDISLRNVNQIDAGVGQVVATDKYRNAYFLSGTSWPRLPSAKLKQITVGLAGIWAINYRNRIYKYGYGRWINVPGSLKQVDAGQTFVVGSNSGDVPFCLRYPLDVTYAGVGRAPWKLMPGKVKYYSCGLYGCWAVNSPNNVYLMSVNPTTCKNTNWQYIAGVKLVMIEASNDGKVFGVTPSGQVYTRTGITARRPQGTRWTRIPMCMPMKNVSYDLGRLWVVTRSGLGMMCTP